MSWNFHNYYADRTNGLISKLNMSDYEREMLIALREQVRARIREVFTESKKIVKEHRFSHMILTESMSVIQSTKLRYLSNENQKELAEIFQEMSEDIKGEFLALTPKFWTQGSFQYRTMNIPFQTPPQEMDIDDGVYLPMAMFEDKPIIGHRLLILLVDASLQSLAQENHGWIFDDSKPTCARIKIPSKNVHIDVPMYAIPKKQFEIMLEAFDSALVSLKKMSLEEKQAYYKLDTDSVNLLLRDQKKWTNSDPKVVDDWFNDSCRRIGENEDGSQSYHLRKICRFIKAWRDAQWKTGGPSSISLMAAVVEILDEVIHDPKNFGTTIELLAIKLPDKFRSGIESPDDSDEKPLFPAIGSKEYGSKEKMIVDQLEEFNKLLQNAKNSSTKEDALKYLNQAFGERVYDASLITKQPVDDVYSIEPESTIAPISISPTVKSG